MTPTDHRRYTPADFEDIEAFIAAAQTFDVYVGKYADPTEGVRAYHPTHDDGYIRMVAGEDASLLYFDVAICSTPHDHHKDECEECEAIGTVITSFFERDHGDYWTAPCDILVEFDDICDACQGTGFSIRVCPPMAGFGCDVGPIDAEFNDDSSPL